MRPVHRAIGRAFSALVRQLTTEASVEGDAPSVARGVRDRHFRGGLAFTQLPYLALLEAAKERLRALRADPDVGSLSPTCRATIDAVEAVLAAAPSNGPTCVGKSSDLPALIRDASGSVHAFARLVMELAGAELSEARAADLLAAITLHDAEARPSAAE